MFRRFALLVLSRLALLATAATLAAVGQGVAVSRLYFLAATPTPNLGRGYPATLYKTAAGSQKLRLMREIVSAADGVDSVLQYGNTIFVDYPHLPPTTAAIIHADQPTLSDSVVFNPAGDLVLSPNYTALTEPRLDGIDELVWITTKRSTRPGGTDTIIGIVGSPAGPGKRIQADALQEYSSLRFDGIPGGPYLQPGPQGVPIGDSIDLKIAGNYVPIERIPEDIAQKILREFGPLVAVTDRYFIFGLQQPPDDSQSGAALNRTGDQIMVHDRLRNKWFTGPREGTCSSSRIFGNWLATVVGYWNPGHGPQPGVAHQRAAGTDALPVVKGVYDVYHGKECFIPGYLALWNLESGQRVAWHTDEEDSEILWASDEAVLYRVNDTIYQARIQSDKIEDALVLVKDDDVPEIHWAFWGTK